MSFFDEIVEAYRAKVGPTKVEYMAAHKRYEAVRGEAAAELAEALRCAPALAEFDVTANDSPDDTDLWWSSPGERAEMCLGLDDPSEATVYFAGEDYGHQFTFDAPLEDAVNLFLAWVDGDVDTVTRYGACPEDWAETIGCAS